MGDPRGRGRRGEKSERQKLEEWVEAQVSGAYEETNVEKMNKIWINGEWGEHMMALEQSPRARNQHNTRQQPLWWCEDSRDSARAVFFCA